MEEKSFLCEAMTKVLRGALPANDALNSIVRRWGLPLPVINQYQAESILSGTALEAFVEKNPLEFDPKGKPFGPLAEFLVIELSGLEIPAIGEAVYDIPSSVPLLNLYGQISEQFMEISKQC
jgi:hypothetical protein